VAQDCEGISRIDSSPGRSQSQELLLCNVPLVVGDFFKAGDFDPLAVLDSGDEIAGLQ